MWTGSVKFSHLMARGRWKVEFFTPPSANLATADGLVPIGELVTERRETVDPLQLTQPEVNYIGLEHIISYTGELTAFQPRPPSTIKSRSKVFQENDVLFGRLRPNLNKVWVADGSVAPGICSTEFFVLVPDVSRVLPMVLRYLLSSHYVTRHAERLQTGTALPRMNLDDLLAIEVPLPDIDGQQILEAELRSQFQKLTALRRQLNSFPREIQDRFLASIEGESSGRREDVAE